MNIRQAGLLLMIIFFSLVIIHDVVRADYLLYELAYLDNSILAVADVLDTGRDQIIAGNGSEVRIYDQGQVQELISGFSGTVTAIAVGDLTGDFRPEILIGTDKGSYYVYQRIQGQWHQIVEQRYLWAPVTYLEVCDLTGNGWGDVIVRTSRGEAFIYLAWDGQLSLFWRSQPNEAVKFIIAADLTGSGSDDVVIARSSGYVGVMSWQEGQLDLIWQNYPWGTIDCLDVVQLQSGRLPEIMVLTGQNIFYTWRWDGDTFVTQRHFPYELDGHAVKFVPGIGLINLSTASGITVYNVGSSSLNQTNSLPLFDVRNLVVVNEAVLVQENSGKYYRLQEVDREEIEIYVNNKRSSNPPELLIYDGRIYLDVDGLASMLDLIRFGNDRIFLVQGLHYFIIDLSEKVVLWKNTPLPVTDSILTDNGKVYVPLSLISLLGYEFEFEYSINELHIKRSWGWW